MGKIRQIVVLGDGGWGTTLAILLKAKGFSVTLWSAFEEQARFLAARRENVSFLKGVRIPKDIRMTSDVRCLADADLVVGAVPSQYLRSVLVKGKKFYRRSCPVVSAIKGIETRTLLRVSEVFEELWHTPRLAV